MTMIFYVKTKPGEVHTLGGKEYKVTKVKKQARGWRVEMVRR